MPKITVYITNHNYGKFLQKSIESVLSQTSHDFELLIIDDDSTDNSINIFKEYSSKPGIKTFFLKNRNHIKNANFALNHAMGKYIMRLDADDWLDPNALMVLSNYLDNNEDVAAVFPGYFTVNKDGHQPNYVCRFESIQKLSAKDKEPHGACTMIRTDKLKLVGGYNEKLDCQDGLDLWEKFKNKYKIASLPTALFYYRQHDNNLTKSVDKIENARNVILHV